MKHFFSNWEKAGIVMKTFIFWAIPLAMFTGCINIPKEEIVITLSVNPGSINFESAGEQRNFNISSNDRWTVSSSAPSWLTLSAKSGSNDSIITVSVDSNTGKSPRNATITINSAAPDLTRTIQISQKPAIITEDTTTSYLTVSPDELNFSAASEDQKSFTVTSNTNWTVDVNSFDLSWLTLSAKSGSNDSIIYVSAESNSSADQRNTIITVNSLTQGVTPRTVKISQERPYLNFLYEEHFLYIGSDNQQFLDIHSNVDWNVSIDYPNGCGGTNWLSVSPFSGKNNGKITLTASEMPEVGDRTARLRVSGGGLTIEKDVQQVKDGDLSVSPSSLSFESAGESKQLTISSDASWSVDCSDTWLKISPTKGVRNGMITVTAEPSTRTRTSTISIRFGDFCSLPVPSEDINVTQAGSAEPEMVFVKGGTFKMGCLDNSDVDCNRSGYETAHDVILSDFYIGKHEVTQGQWSEITGSNPSTSSKGDNYPVETVSWNDIVGTSGDYMEIKNTKYYANGFIYKLNKTTNKQYRLPTESEWEYAARGGQSIRNYKYSGSNTVQEVAWYNLNSENRTHEVGKKKATNDLDIYDMSGNVYEWCSDWYGPFDKLEKEPPQTDPIGPPAGQNRVIRGGSFSYAAVWARVSARDGFDRTTKYNHIGFRLALSSDKE